MTRLAAVSAQGLAHRARSRVVILRLADAAQIAPTNLRLASHVPHALTLLHSVHAAVRLALVGEVHARTERTRLTRHATPTAWPTCAEHAPDACVLAVRNRDPNRLRPIRPRQDRTQDRTSGRTPDGTRASADARTKDRPRWSLRPKKTSWTRETSAPSRIAEAFLRVQPYYEPPQSLRKLQAATFFSPTSAWSTMMPASRLNATRAACRASYAVRSRT